MKLLKTNMTMLNPMRLSVIILILSSCSERIEWKVEKNETRLVIEGCITSENKNHEVIVSHTLDYFDEDSDGRISGAEIRVTVDDKEHIYEESQAEKGLYHSIEAFAGEPGKIYRLQIILPEEIGGFTDYEAETNMPRLVPFDSIMAKPVEIFDEEEVTIHVWGKEPEPSQDFYLGLVYRNGELLTNEVKELIFYDDELLQGFTFDEFALFGHEDLEVGDEIILEFMSIEEGYYNFLTYLEESKEGGDPFGFSGPPSNVFGNVSHNAFGYFYAAEKKVFETVARE